MHTNRVDTRWQDTGGGGAVTRNLRLAYFNMGTAREFPSHAHPSTATLLELAQRADILCLQETHLHAHQWPGFLQSFRLATDGGSGLAAHAPDVAAQRSFTGVAFLFTRSILAEGLVIRESTLRTDTAGRWASVQIEWTGITITLAGRGVGPELLPLPPWCGATTGRPQLGGAWGL